MGKPAGKVSSLGISLHHPPTLLKPLCIHAVLTTCCPSLPMLHPCAVFLPHVMPLIFPCTFNIRHASCISSPAVPCLLCTLTYPPQSVLCLPFNPLHLHLLSLTLLCTHTHPNPLLSSPPGSSRTCLQAYTCNFLLAPPLTLIVGSQ